MTKPWNFEGASCQGLDTDFFFPEGSATTENLQAKAICKNCVWQKECLSYALEWNVVGIWGGTLTKERAQIRRKLNIIPKPLSNERFVS